MPGAAVFYRSEMELASDQGYKNSERMPEAIRLF